MGTRSGRQRARHVAVLVVGGLLAVVATGGCGARWDDEQLAEVRARATRSAPSGPNERGTSGSSSDVAAGSPTDPGLGTGGSAGTTGGAGTGGTGPGSTIGGGGDGGGPSGPLPCSAPSDEVGVTDREITVGAISSLSGPVPGLGSAAAAAVRAYVGYRNATGGVCGRKVVLREADDGTDISRYRTTLQDLATKVLGIAGGFAVGDIGSESIIAAHSLPVVNSPTGRTGELPTVFDINPDFPEPDPVIGKYQHLYDLGARTVSMSYIAVDQSRIEANIQRGLMEAAGLEVVHVNELPLSTLSYDSPARAAANSGADYLWVTADTSGQAAMARSVRDTGHQWLIKEFSYTSYGTSFISQAGSAAEGVTSWLRSLPTEEASSNPAMATFVEWMNRVSPGSPMDLFSIDSYVATKAFLDTLEKIPGPITREGLVEQLAQLHDYDAEGMYAPIDLGRDLSKGCFMAMIVRNGAWERYVPSGSGNYLC
ncbi:MAG: ABC transporter substrate-binding protein [Actinomycetota bacterium]|nr:ABC transporter substrate-binding protein [Actinomycetota bacterium]